MAALSSLPHRIQITTYKNQMPRRYRTSLQFTQKTWALYNVHYFVMISIRSFLLRSYMKSFQLNNTLHIKESSIDNFSFQRGDSQLESANGQKAYLEIHFPWLIQTHRQLIGFNECEIRSERILNLSSASLRKLKGTTPAFRLLSEPRSMDQEMREMDHQNL